MTMHLERGLTTTSVKKRKERITKAQQSELERGWRERNVRLRQIGLAKETFEQYIEWVYGRGKKEKTQKGGGAKNKETFTKAANTSASSNENIEGKNTRPVEENDSNMGVVQSNIKIWVTGPCSSKPSPTYTGSKIIGIGTMHKSNMVPIFSDDEAKDISKMRR
ncbi:MAG TPA: hypothetical protein VIY47_08710 [Ignavibacteriaceae bacterium]